jgi:hypothetical protein
VVCQLLSQAATIGQLTLRKEGKDESQGNEKKTRESSEDSTGAGAPA